MYLPAGFLLSNRYEIRRVLGQGGFGITYLARDRLLSLPVAIKEYLPRQLAGRQLNESRVMVFSGDAGVHYAYGLQKFLEEARALAKFAHLSGIVSVRDYFEANNSAYMVMEYLEGQTLKEYLQHHGDRIPWEEALRLLLPILTTLESVHAAGLLHRDISPDNIFITTNGQVKLLDFGAARYFAGEQSRSLSVILKPGYAPEEQYRSKGHQGPWTDVYACAATLYRAITGQTPLEALDRLAEDTLVPPSRLGVAIPPAAERGLLQGLAVRPEQRLPNMAALRQAFTGSGWSDATTASPKKSAPLVTPLPSYQQRRLSASVAAVLGAVALLLLIFVGAAIFWQSQTPSVEKKPPATSATPQAAPTSQLTHPKVVSNREKDFLLQAGMGDEYRQKGDYAGALEHYNRAIELIPDYCDWIYNNRGLVYLHLQDYHRALKDFNQALTLNPKAGVSYNNRAVVQAALQKWPQALEDLQKAEALGHKINQNFLAQVNQALAGSQTGLSASSTTSPPNPQLARSLREEGQQLYKQGRFAEAIDKLEASVQADPSDAVTHYLLGWSYNQIDRSPELALAAFQTAIRLKNDYALAYDGQTWTLNKLGRHAEAVQSGQKTLNILYNFPDAHYNLGMAYLGLGQRELALRQYQILQKMNADKSELLMKNIMEASPAGARSQSSSTGPRWPWTSFRPITPEDLLPLLPAELELMRNEIYARHGWVFNRQDLKSYFKNQSWYRPRGDAAERERVNAKIEAELTPLEKNNVQVILQREKLIKK